MNQEMKMLVAQAESGDSKAQLELAVRFATGEGIKKDSKLALYWFNEAALDDCPEAYYNLGLIYYLGEGVQKDLQQALIFFSEGVACGSSDACLVMGEAYESGDLGLSVNYREAVVLYLTAARLGSVKGIRAVGELLSSEKINADELSAIMKNFKLS